MLAIYLCREGARTERIVVDTAEVVLARHGDIPLVDTAEACRLVLRPAGVFLVQEAGVVRVNGKPVDRATPLYETDKVFVGAYQFMIERLSRRPDATEERLLAEIAAGDDASRLVYADWLEENGDARRAEFLRCQENLRAFADASEPAFVEESRRLRKLAFVVDQDWRVKVARVPVENCNVDVRFDFECPKQWSELAETGTHGVRFCELCRQQVFYCTNLVEARGHASAGRCVAIDPANERTAGDLARARRTPMLGAIAPPRNGQS